MNERGDMAVSQAMMAVGKLRRVVVAICISLFDTAGHFHIFLNKHPLKLPLKNVILIRDHLSMQMRTFLLLPLRAAIAVI